MAIEYKNHRASTVLMIIIVQQSYEIHKYMYMYKHVFDILHMQALHK